MLPAPDHDEARRELTDLLDGSIGAVPLAALVVELEPLEVAERPKGRAVLGRHRTQLHALAPLHVAFTESMSADSKHSGGAA